MKYKEFLLYLYFIYIFLGKSNCEDIYINECENNSNDFINNYINSYLSSNISPLKDYDFKYRKNSKFYPKEILETINPGEVQSFLLLKETVYIFNIDSINYNIENDLIIYFYSLDCEIQVTGEIVNDKNNITIEKISNYENDAFYAIIEKDKLNESYIVLNTLIYSKDENKRNRKYHLMVNSVEHINNTKLTIVEKKPTLLAFNNNTINKINLQYNLINNNDNPKNPISISFFIKERVKFVVAVYNDENELYKKNVGYLDRILIDTEQIPESSPYINISIEKDESLDAVMIIKVTEDYESPINFQKNILNIGFIPSSVSYQYYYMEIFEGEYGDILLNNKRYKGSLFSKIITKEEANENNIFNNSEYYKKEENEEGDTLKYNQYSSKITFNSDVTKICKEGCYLLITYFSPYFNKTKNKEILGTEFTLITRIFEQEEEFRSQIVNIPSNEYIFGSFESSSVKIHYYSFYIPNNTKSIQLEININYIGVFIKKGIKKMNIINVSPLEFKYFGNFIYTLEPKYFELESFEDEYITFAFSNYLQIDKSHYYFRILLNNTSNNSDLIYPLDTNKANFCKTTKKEDTNIYSCFFFIDNLYKDLSNNLIIYAYGHQKVNYTAWIADKNEGDYYSITLDSLNYKNITSEDSNIYFKIDKNQYNDYSFILINFESTEEEDLTILLNFYDNITFFPPLQIYSYQFIYLYDNETLNFDFTKITQQVYRIVINNTYGNGEITFEPKSDFMNHYNRLITGNRTLSYDITSELETIQIFNNQKNNAKDENELLFNLKIVYELENSTFDELYLDNLYNEKTEVSFPIRFCLRDIKNNGADVNFYFYNLNEEDLIIKGYVIKYDLMKLTSEKTNLPIDYGREIKGRFDNRIGQGLIIFEKEESSYISDYYYLIEIYNQNQNQNKNQTNITMDIYASSKDAFPFSMPLNKYISGSFDLLSDKILSQRYYINDVQNSSSKEYFIEFSSNYKHLDLVLSEYINSIERIDVAGIRKYHISINATDKKLNYFDIVINTNIKNNEKTDDYCNVANYIIIYYQEEKEIPNYIISLEGQVNKNSPNITIINKNPNELKGYTITCIFTIYKKDKILKNELINTTAPIKSEISFKVNDTFNGSFRNSSYPLNGKHIDSNYKGTVFVKLENNNLEQVSYYSLPFDIKEIKEKEEEDDDTKKNIIISSIAVVVFIIFIILVIRYRKVLRRNQDLEKKVHDISFADETTSSKEDEDIKVTFV